MKQLEIILSFAATCVGLLITTLTFFAKYIKNAKLKKATEEAIKIGNAVLPFIREAEKFSAFSGEEKKAYVMTKANQYAITNDIDFNEEIVSEKIEELINLTKQVNTKSSTKEKAEIKNEIKTLTNNSWL